MNSREGIGGILAQLYFRYGAMNSGKSIEILKVAHNYEEQAKRVIVMTSAVDTRSGQGVIASRVGHERPAVAIDGTLNIYDYVARENQAERVFCVLIDESQFLSADHIDQCAQIVDDLNIPVMAFGLKNDFQNHLFTGSERLLLVADKIEEVKTICWFCEKKAIMNMRVHNEVPCYDGDQVQIGGNESYYPVCRKHYKQPPMQDGKIAKRV